MAARHRELRVMLPNWLMEALNLGARRQLSKPSVYARQILLQRLRQEGIVSLPEHEAASVLAEFEGTAR